MFKKIFNFNRNKKNNDIKEKNVIEEKNIIKETNLPKEEKVVEDKNNDIINELFNSNVFYSLEMKNEKGEFVKYTQLIGDDTGDTSLLNLIFTDKDKADKYILNELVDLVKYEIRTVEINIEDIFNYINDLKNKNCTGIIINYPYNWAIYKFN